MVNALVNGRILLPDREVRGQALLFDEKIRGISSEVPSDARVLDAEGCYISPGFVDVHIHGYLGEDASDGSVPGAVYLYSAALSDAEILADTGRAQALRAAAPGGSAANGVRFAQTFTFSSVDSGSYKVLCAKEGKHAPRILSVSVADGDVSLGTVSLLLYGDVNDDGAVNAKDALQISRYAAGKSSVFDAAADPAEEAYLLFAADVNGDGAANARDALQISRSAAGKSSVFDVMD